MIIPGPPNSEGRSYWQRFLLSIGVLLLLAVIWYVRREPTPPAVPSSPFVEGPMEEVTRLGLVALRQPSKGTLSVLVIYAQFQDEAGLGEEIPADAEQFFDPELPGSFTHYYNEMSFGQLRVQGTVLPKRYTSDQPASAYLAATSSQKGRYGDFAAEILKKVDADVDMGQFDNDGPDGIPNSGDDDRIVDYVFLVMRSVPHNFLLGRATGIAGLGRDVVTQEKNPKGRAIMVLRKRYVGSILDERSYAQTVGIMTHEFGHGLGLPDLYDVSFQDAPDQDPSEDSAGIGRWVLMGHGAFGWTDDASRGPSPMSAWTREQLGWLGIDNERLRVVQVPAAGLPLADVGEGGGLLKVFLEPESPDVTEEERAYLLIERVSRRASYYNRQLPGEGVLIWHVRPTAMDNMDERYKLVDLVCADGLFADAGYPKGRMFDLLNGGDNLDYWAHDAAYAQAHAGNFGDASDLFDGDRYRDVSIPASLFLSRQNLDVSINGRGGLLTATLEGPAAVATAIGESAAQMEGASAQLPAVAQLLPNYPNPFNPSTTIPFVMPEDGDVRIVIFNSLGQTVRILGDEWQVAGEHEVVWDGNDERGTSVASGVYHCRLEIDAAPVQVRRMSLVR